MYLLNSNQTLRCYFIVCGEDAATSPVLTWRFSCNCLYMPKAKNKSTYGGDSSFLICVAEKFTIFSPKVPFIIATDPTVTLPSTACQSLLWLLSPYILLHPSIIIVITVLCRSLQIWKLDEFFTLNNVKYMRALSAALKEMERKATSEQKKTKKRIRRRDDSDSEEPTMSIGLGVDPVIANPEDSDDEDDTDSVRQMLSDEDDTDSVRQMLSDEDEDDTDSVRQMLYDKVTYPGVVLVQAYEAGACAGKSLMTWDDFDPGKRPSYYLYKIEDIDEIDELGRDVFHKLRKNASERCICQLMLLAYNLKDAEGHDVFGDIPHQLLDINWKDFSEISGSPLLTGRSRFHINAIPKGNNREDVRERSIGYCYLAASYLRMYTKSAENFALIADHLRKRFPDLYAFEFPFSSFHPDGKTVKRVKTVFETNSRLRNTFYNLIYAGEICPNGRDLKDFLYVTHISYTGLHSYMLFLKCMSAYNVNSAELENFLRTNRFKSELDALSTIFTDFFNGGKGKKAKMWRFARIFNSSFMKQLQTKKCLLFTCTLAYLYNMAGMSQTQNQNVLNIAQIKDAPEGVKRKAKCVAMIVRRHLLEKAASASHHPQVLKKVKRR